ncbi:DUF2158 domain-containing protein [Myroides odoratus]|uniref:DUF2158 domain-containing protein n=1 Tax=Myroides odoratus TaxID=256 RepID=UPI00333F025A
MEKFKTGDVVQLKSGSPKMTIYFVGSVTVSVMYFDNLKNEIIKERDIDPLALKLADSK